MKYLNVLIGLVILILIVIIIVLLYRRYGTPWEPVGHITVAAYTVPYATKEEVQILNVGIDDVILITQDGKEVRASTLTRRFSIDKNDTRKYFLVETNIAEGAYKGIRFTIKSPELRNAWKGDTPPDHVTLIAETLTLNVPFQVTRDKETTILLGFERRDIIRKQEDGNVFLPVVQVEVREDAQIIKETERAGEVSGGVLKFNGMFGMDAHGTMRFNYRAPRNNTYMNNTYMQ